MLAAMRSRLPDILADIEELVCCESPSSDLPALARSADAVAAVGERRLGAPPERIMLEGRPHLRWRLGPTPSRVLLLGHHDTVWPLGSRTTHPYRVCGQLLRGPGCFDMKAGLVIALHAAAGRAGVTLLVTADEELGAPTSRALIEAEARAAEAVLVLEGAAPDGALKIARKGVSMYQVEVAGSAAHAGLEPERGVNATIELAHQVLAVSVLADPDRGTTVTPTLLSAGTAANTVPAAGMLAVDVRVADLVEQRRVDAEMHALRSVLPGAGVHVTGGPNRPPLEPSASAALFERAAIVAAALGLAPLRAAMVSGGSDGNLAAGVGTPTVDGLGAVGGGAHADDEHVLIDELPARTALVAALIDDLLSSPTNPGAVVGAQQP